MNFTEYFNIDVEDGHASLDFIDIDINDDTKLFLEPTLIECVDDEWYKICAEKINSFFDELFFQYEINNKKNILELLDCAHEPNETKLGLGSKESIKKGGRGNTAEKLYEVFSEIIDKKLLDKGLVKNPMDLCVFVHDFAEDGMSDLVTNIIRKELNEFTINQCEKHGVELEDKLLNIGKSWNNETKSWEDVIERALTINGKCVLLVPKNIVRRKYIYSVEQYMSRKILEHRQNYHVINDTSLVEHTTDKNGNDIIKKPSKKLVRREDVGDTPTKDYAVDYTFENPDLIKDYRKEVKYKAKLGIYSLRDEELDEILYGDNI